MFTINFFGDEPKPAPPAPVAKPAPEKKPSLLRKFWVGYVMDQDYSEASAKAAYADMLKELGRE